MLYVVSQKIAYDKLKPNFLAISLKNDIEKFLATSKTTLQTKIVEHLFEQQTQLSKIPTEGIISAKSSLNSEIFAKIMCTLGLSAEQYESDYKLIDEVLLNMRNYIAHGVIYALSNLLITRFLGDG